MQVDDSLLTPGTVRRATCISYELWNHSVFPEWAENTADGVPTMHTANTTFAPRMSSEI
jgi:hypothetical protein